MKVLEQPTVRIVLYEGTGARPLDEASRLALTSNLLNGGYTVTCTATNGHASKDHTSHVSESVMIVLGQFDNGVAPEAADESGQIQIHTCDLTGLSADQVVQAIKKFLATDQIEHNQPGTGWKPWFPVIDYDRCTNCMQCLSFCLFDVYGTSSEGQIQVQNNDNCKTDCPACSRVCPEVAILFPKYASGPINGDVVREEDLKREAMKVDISALLGGDIYANLKKRSDDARERFAKERDDKRALSERMRCLNKLAGQMEVPMEVLKSLPSADEIREKAQTAKAKAEQALARNSS